MNTDNNNMSKICRVCNEMKNINDYPKDPSYKDGTRNKCRVCWNKEHLNIILRNYKPIEKQYCSYCDRYMKSDNMKVHLISQKHNNNVVKFESKNIIQNDGITT